MNIVFIGNSITQGALIATPSHDAPPVKAALYLTKQPSVTSVKYSNQGVLYDYRLSADNGNTFPEGESGCR